MTKGKAAKAYSVTEEGKRHFALLESIVEEDKIPLEDLNVIMQPIAYSIVTALASKPYTTKELVEKLNIDKKYVSFHLSLLQKIGYVEGALEVTKPPTEAELGKAAKTFGLTRKGKEWVFNPNSKKMQEELEGLQQLKEAAKRQILTPEALNRQVHI